MNQKGFFITGCFDLYRIASKIFNRCLQFVLLTIIVSFTFKAPPTLKVFFSTKGMITKPNEGFRNNVKKIVLRQLSVIVFCKSTFSHDFLSGA